MARIAVLGAGPVGLEAAAAAVAAGHDVRVLERGDVAQHVSEWGHVRLFSPFSYNVGPAGRALLDGRALPQDDALLNGREYRDAYLAPLADALARRADLRPGCRVVSVSRTHLLKDESIGAAARGQDPFRILAEETGRERVFEADVVLDCTGTYGRPNRLGPGGAPALGERLFTPRITYGMPDVLGAQRARFAGVRTLVVGRGHSAATAALALARLVAEAAGTELVWAVRRRAPEPFRLRADDPLPERHALESAANALATAPPPGCAYVPAAHVVSVAAAENGPGVIVTLETPGGPREERVERVIAATGAEPDDSIYRQLQIHECYASRAPMKLAAHLLASAGGAEADCLETGGGGPELLRNPEPNYFILGSKSFGRNSAFLMRTGYEQVTAVLPEF